jgi:Putative Actinobacterial Holin-X, holin superfamily III
LPFLGHGQLRRTVPIRRGGRERDGGKPASDVVQLILDYAKQETLGPLKGLGRFIVFGLIGAIALSGGAMLLLLALLRGLQTETGTTFRGNWSWAPYLVTAGVATILAVLAAWRITKGPAAKQKASPKGET